MREAWLAAAESGSQAALPPVLQVEQLPQQLKALLLVLGEAGLCLRAAVPIRQVAAVSDLPVKVVSINAPVAALQSGNRYP